jgi:polyisoprenyl-phosphate glycosyltransferase
MDSTLQLSIVVPVYNNAETLEELNKRVIQVLLKSFTDQSNFEIIYVVDGSPDKSLDVLLSLQSDAAKDFVRIKIIELSANYGQTAAIIAGLEFSKAMACVVISADLQDPPEAISRLIASWKNGSDIVISTRATRRDSWLNILTSKIAHAVFRVAQPEMPKNGFDFFLISSEAGKNLVKLQGRNRFLQGDILSLGFRRQIISHDRVERKQGKSSYNFSSRMKLFIDSLFENSRFPIQFIFTLGTVISAIGFIFATLSIISYLRGDAPFSGFVAIFSSVLFLGGIQIFLLGLIGQFIFRTFEISRRRPLYIIREVF